MTNSGLHPHAATGKEADDQRTMGIKRVGSDLSWRKDRPSDA
jgi:hypothetical protein